MEKYMRVALEEAKKAFLSNEVPVGCVIVHNGEIISKAYNQRHQNQIATHHAEILAIEEANKKLNTWRLSECEIYITLEPCIMCCGAIIQSKIKKVIFGAFDTKNGGVNTTQELITKTKISILEVHSGILEKECSELLKTFFKNRRKS